MSPEAGAGGVVCPCCGWAFDSFLPHGRVPRPGARCPSCGALERHRLLYLYLWARTDFFQAQLDVLHFAPERCFHRWFRRLPNLRYTSADLLSPHAMERVDITRIPYPPGTFDVVLCSHVLEHVPDDRTAISEVYRVLRPGGWAILHVPLDRSRASTYEDWRIVAPEDREREFGQSDHVRVYGRDFPDRLAAAGFHVTVDAFGAALEEEEARRFGVRPFERTHLCTKPPARSLAPVPEDAPAPVPEKEGSGSGPLPLPRLVAAAEAAAGGRVAETGEGAVEDAEAGGDRVARTGGVRAAEPGSEAAAWAGVPATALRMLPRGATVLVVSRGDEALLDLEGRRGWHFPQVEGGVYAGHHPADDAEAIAHLEELRARGGEYLLVPEPSLWWLQHYRGFREHLERRHRRLPGEGASVVYRLAPGGT